MTIRELQPEEFYKLTENEWLQPEARPKPGMARVAVAEVDGKIVGFAIAQVMVLVEPIWVEDRHRFGFIGKRLFEKAKSFINGTGGFMCHAATEKDGQYLERLGLQKTRGTAYEGRL